MGRLLMGQGHGNFYREEEIYMEDVKSVYIVSESGCQCRDLKDHYVYESLEHAIDKLLTLYDKYKTCYRRISHLYKIEDNPKSFRYTCVENKEHFIGLREHELLQE
jgi:hypothetical protein